MAKRERNTPGIRAERIFGTAGRREQSVKHDAVEYGRIGESVRDDPALGVDPGTADSQKDAPEIKGQNRWNLLCQTDFQQDCHKKSSRKSLNHQITAGVRRAAMTAAPPEHQITDDGQIVVPADIGAARGAVAGRSDHRLPSGNAPDADIEKTAETGAEGKGGKNCSAPDDRIIKTQPLPPVVGCKRKFSKHILFSFFQISPAHGLDGSLSAGPDLKRSRSLPDEHFPAVGGGETQFNSTFQEGRRAVNGVKDTQ